MTPEFAPPGRRRVILTVIMLGHFLTVSSIGSLTVALPTIQQDLDATASDLQWTLALYQIGYATLLISGGRLGDVLGPRRVFVIGLWSFTIASALSAAAPSTETLIAARLLQGIAGGLVAPQVLGMIQLTFPPLERPKAFSTYAMVSGGGFVVGQLVSGLVIDADVFGLGWRSVFALTVVVGAVAATGAMIVLPHLPALGQRIDVVGMLMISAIGLATLYPVIQSRNTGWGWEQITLVATSVVALALFLVYQRHRARRGLAVLVDLDLFRRTSYRTGLILTTIFNFQAFGPFFLLTITMQLGFGLSPTAAALMTAITALSTVVAAPLSARYSRRLGHRVFIVSGALGLAGAVATVLATATGQQPSSVLRLIPALVLLGAFGGMFLPSVVRLTLSDVSGEQSASSAGVVQAVQQFSGAIGAAVFGSIFFGVLDDRTSESAYDEAISTAFLLAIATCIVLIVASVLLRPGRRRAAEPRPAAVGSAETASTS